ncbi:MAG: hypothetical protein KDB80_15465 [Planctomycetes bacterium]|nr:hypothetical protein [Planctomycetota bacterium]
MMRSTTRRLPISAILLLAVASCDVATPDALRGLRSEDPFVRRLAVVSLRDAPKQDHRRVTEALFSVAVHDNSPLRPEVDATLRVIATRSPELLVERLVARRDLRPARVITLLESAGASAIVPLTAALDQVEGDDRVPLAKLLAHLGAVERLDSFAASGPDAAATVIAALEPLGESARQRLVTLSGEVLATGDAPAVRLASRHSPTAAWTMLTLDPDARAASAIVRGLLECMAERGEYSPIAAMILANVDAERLEHVLAALLDAAESSIHSTAAEVLGARHEWRAMLEHGVAPRWIALSAAADVDQVRTLLSEIVASGDAELAERARATAQLLVGQ